MKIVSNIRMLLLIFVSLGITSCAKFSYDRPAGQIPAPTSRAVEAAVLDERDSSTALALSGGGIRSAYYNLGAMKALHDAGKLEEIDLISSVSGGGYAAYWLLSAEYVASNDANFGDELFSERNFPASVCRVMAYSNFVTTADALRGAARRSSLHLYHRAIGRSFGFADPDAEIRMSDLLGPTEADRLPYWIVNTTRYEDGRSLSQDGIFEITPLMSGSETQGYGRWADWSMTLRQATSISGAAVDGLKQSVAEPSRDDSEASSWVWDGGYSDNLAAYSAITRGVDEVTVIDAEHDPSYEFESFNKLKEMLESSNWQVDLLPPESDGARLQVSYSKGIVTHNITGDEVRITYLKMSLPTSLDGILQNDENLRIGSSTQTSFMAALEGTRTRRAWNCDEMKGQEINLLPWMSYSVAGYSEYLNEQNYTRHFQNFRWKALRTGFPQYTTVDQSYFNDQARAFLALGYLQAREMIGDASETSDETN